MKSKSYIFLFALIFMIVFSISAVSADDLQTYSGEVSGDVDVATVSPWNTSGELNYDILPEANIKSADVFVNVYSGSTSPTHGAKANVTLETKDGTQSIASEEELWFENKTTGAAVYPINNHTDKSVSDYQMRYDITSLLKGLNGSSIAIKVDTFKLDNKSFDGRIKLIALVVAYDDGDDDYISYWVDSTQRWTNNNMTETFDTVKVRSVVDASLTNVALSSKDGNYTLNAVSLGNGDKHFNGSYYQYNYWDVSDEIKPGLKTEFTSYSVGSSLKNVLTVLKVEAKAVDVSFDTEYKNTCFAGTNNTLTINVNSHKAGKYKVQLFADGSEVNSTEVELDGENVTKVLLTDSKIRDVNETTVNGADNAKVNYTVVVSLNDEKKASAEINVPVLYNGNLGYDMEYNVTGITDPLIYVFSGDIVFDVKDYNTYLGSSDMNRTDVWTVNLTTDDELVGTYLIIPYNWFNPKYNETEDMFNVTFNGQTITPNYFYRDQSNLGGYGKYGYGVLIYNVMNLFNTNGNNTLVLNKKYADTPAVYPSALVYWYNSPHASIKQMFMNFGVDLLSNASNNAGRIVKSDSSFLMPYYEDGCVNATIYVLAASANKGDGNIVVNGKEFANVWNGTKDSTDLFVGDFTDVLNETNKVSFVATGGTILALPQFMLFDTGVAFDIDSIETEYSSNHANFAAYAGTNNTLTVDVFIGIDGNYTINLYADSDLVDNITKELTKGTYEFLFTDPTIRPIDETTVNGANNTEVTYSVELIYEDKIIRTDYITVPVLYNGYFGYDLEYNATGINEHYKSYFSGDFVVDVQDDSTYLGATAMNRTDVWTVNLDEDCDIVATALLIPYNWFNSGKYNETEDMFNVTFNGQTITPNYFYRDQSNLGKYGTYGYGVLIYSVKKLLNISGENTLVLNKNYPTPAVYPSALLYWYNTPNGTLKRLSLDFGVDLLSDEYNDAGRIVKSDTNFDLKDEFANVTLYVFAAGAQAGEGNIIVNGVEFADVWNGTSYSTDFYTQDITDIFNKTNNISFVATGKTILALPQFMVSDTGVHFKVADIKTEYTSVPAIYAGTNNTLTVTLTSNIDANYTVELYADDEKVAEMNVTLVNGTNTVLLTDPTIRPIDETTVKGANNTEVTYTVELRYGSYSHGNYITVPVLYNGYFGYDMEYNVTGFDSFYSLITGDLVVDVQDESTYLGAKVMNRTDVWTVNLGNESEIIGTALLIPYNWFNSGKYNETEDMFNVTFNGKSIKPWKQYRDQANLGNYGNYGYGVFVYTVGDILNTSGENTLVLTKMHNDTPAVYPSVLAYWYNTPGGSLKEVSMSLGADLLDNSYNKANRTVKADTDFKLDDVKYVNATIYVLAAGAQAGEGNIIVNGKEFANVWNGTTQTTDLFTEDITDIVGECSNVSFVSTGKTLLALPQFVVADIGFDFFVESIETEYSSNHANFAAYAGTNNTLIVTVSTTKDAEFTIELLANGEVVDEVTLNLTNGTHKVFLTDPTIRDIDETTVNGANNTHVMYDVEMYYGSYRDDDAIMVPVLYNGYLGYDMEYNNTGFNLFHYLIDGDFVVDVQNESTYLGTAAMNRTDVWTVNITGDSYLVDAIVLIPYNWFNAKLYNETPDMFNVTFNGESIAPKYFYRDQSNLGSSGRYGYGVLVYRVSDLLNVSGENTLELIKNNPTPAVYPSVLAYWYDTPGGNFKEITFMVGADLLYNNYNAAGRPVESNTQLFFMDDEFVNATIYVLAGGAQTGEGNIIVNGKEFANVWNGTSKTTDLFVDDISDVVDSVTNVSFVSTGGTVLDFAQIIVAETDFYLTIDSIKTEYTSVPTAYAGTNNTLTVTVTCSDDYEYLVELFDGDKFVNSIYVELTEGTNTFTITDPTIRPVNETTVNGANNTEVTYWVSISNGIYSYDWSITVPVLYNGNLGKDMEYDARYIEDYEIFTVTGGVEVQTQDASTYMAAGALNRTDVFTIALDNDSSLEKAFIYIAYNWDKTGVNGPAFNVTFNGNIITPKSSYRDQSNLGKYGKYGYGMFVYDVTEFAKAGENTLFISKQKDLTAVYPTNFIYLYNNNVSRIVTTVYMANGADLLSNANNNAERIVKTGDVIAAVPLNVYNASLYVFAASAQKGEGNIVFNGTVDVDVWNGTDKTFDTYMTDITESVGLLNEVEFIATGSTILALNQMIVIQSVVKEVPEVNIEVPSEVNVGDNVTVVINIPYATGEVTAIVDGKVKTLPLDKTGTATIVMENVSEGLHGIGVIYLGDYGYLPSAGIKFFEAGEEPVVAVATDLTNIVIYEDLNISMVLVDANGNVIANAPITYTINGTANTTVTAADGSFVIPAVYGAAIDVQFAGNETLLATNTTITLNAPEIPVVKIATRFNITNNAITINGYAVDTKAGEHGIAYATTLLDANGNPISDVFIQFGVNNKIYNRTTYENGSFQPYHLDMSRAGRYTMAFSYGGNDKYNSTFAVVCVDLDKKPIKIKASNKSYKASATKKYTVTLSTIVGSSADGKAHLRSGLKVTMKINGKTYNAKTDSKGQATFKLTNISKKGKYTASISYAGDSTYETATKSVKITVN